MKVAVLQPYYSFDERDLDLCYTGMIKQMDAISSDVDLIVLPEYCDIPAATRSKDAFHASIARYNADILSRAKALAVRCSAIVFVNAADLTDSGPRNTTYAIDRNGKIVGKYYKAHPAPSEVRTESEGGNEIDVSYSYEYREPYVLELEGLRFGFMTCYDFYFYEAYAPLARQGVDVIIGTSHQRTDTHSALSIIGRFLAYHTNAYLVRSAVSLGEDKEICGCSTVISPSGDVLLDMKSEIGVGYAEFDPKKKYYKSAGFRGKEKAHYEYIEDGRRPWLYRNGGAAIIPFADRLPYPHLCAHRGFSRVAPENSMPAFGAAVSLGASEIEFDLWPSADGVIVSCHDAKLDRVSNGLGLVSQKTYAELTELDFGSKFGEGFAGLGIVTFEEILKKFAGHTVMNVHVKTPTDHYDEGAMREIIRLIRKYDACRHAYLMISNDEVIRQFKAYAPEIEICVGHDKNRPWEIVDRAIALGCKRVQLFRPYFTREMIEKAHANGIVCNVFFADEIELAKEYLDMGVDVILTNDYLKIKNGLGLK